LPDAKDASEATTALPQLFVLDLFDRFRREYAHAEAWLDEADGVFNDASNCDRKPLSCS